MVALLALLAAVPMSRIALSGLDDISDVATTRGQALGQWAFFSRFQHLALCAMLTS